MSMENTEAIVLKTVDFSESSLVLTLFSRDFGKIRALAKGGRRLKGPFESALDILARIRVTFLRKNSDALDLLTEAKLVRRFHPNSRNLAGVYGAYYAIELLNAFTDDYDPSPEAYDRTVEALARFEEGEYVMRTIFRYEWSMLELFGHQPSLKHCIECGTDLLRRSDQEPLRVLFGLLDGGVLCHDCAPSHPETISIGLETMRTIFKLVHAPTDGGTWKTLPISEPVKGEIRWFFNRFICTVLERKPRMHDYFSLIHREDQES